MLKALAGNKVFLGLEKMNVEKLKEGLPMLVRLKELGLPNIKIAIAFDKKQFSVHLPTASDSLVVVKFDNGAIRKLRNGQDIMVHMRIVNSEYIVTFLYGDTKEIIASDIEKKYGLKMPVIDPINTQPM